MPKQYQITKIEYNQKMGGKYTGAFLHTKNIENDKPRKDFVFENSKQFKVLQECAVGNIVELKIVKNGDYFNLAKDDDAIVLVAKEKKEETKPEEKQEAVSPTPIKEYKKEEYKKEDPEKQAAIIRQNALTNATNLVIANGVSGNLDNSIKYIIAAAIQFAKYTSGEDMTEYLLADNAIFQMEEEAPFEPDKPKRGRKPAEPKPEEPKGEFGE